MFNDGYDSDLIGDDEDRKRLESMTEKEREEEIYRRTEQRDLLMRRFEMKKKLKQQQREAARADREKRREERRKEKLKNKKKNVEKSPSDSKNTSIDDNNDSLNKLTTSMDRRKANESKRKDTEVSKALANLKADREKKKQQGFLFFFVNEF